MKGCRSCECRRIRRYRLWRVRAEPLHKRSDRSKNNCGIEFLRRHLVGAASPDSAVLLCGLLRCDVAWPGKHEKVALFVKRNLRDQVRGVAKTINAKTSRAARFAIRTITD